MVSHLSDSMKSIDEMRQLGDYRLIKQVGQGSLGALFIAEHRFTKKEYALKILPEELAKDSSFVSRFEEEISSISALDHPNIAKVHNVSFSQGIYFLVTESIIDKYGEPTNLFQYYSSRQKQISEIELIEIATQIASALDYAHSRKVIHRALKLNNILIGPEDSNIKVILTDFNLSKIVGIGAVLSRTFKAVAEMLEITSQSYAQKLGQDLYPSPSVELKKLIPLHHSFLQNFCFLSPEQKHIDKPADEKVDVYAFGILIYFLLMGEFPEGCFDMPSKRRKNLSWNWDLVISECLKTSPNERPKSLEELLLKASNFVEFAVPEPQKPEESIPIAKSSSETKASSSLVHVSLDESKNSAYDYATIPSQPRGKGILQPQERVVKEYQPEKREIKNVVPILTDMVVISGDLYARGNNNGCRDELPRHQVRLSTFGLDIHPVTNEQFARYLDAMGEEKDNYNHDIIKLKDSRIKKSSGRFIIEPGYAKHPVVGVTWYGAVAYAAWIGKRLPTEAEWEVACCGGLENPMYSYGETIEKTQANFFSSDTTGVMSYPPNQYGLYDMAGNVYEWCRDWYEYSYYATSAQEPDFPKGPHQGVYRVLRGGCWKSLKEDLRCSKRHRNNPGAANGTYGFRCASDIVE